MCSKTIRASTPPRFRQIVSALKQGITDGTLTEHSPLQSERVVAEQHGVSRMTARRALEAIEAEGLAYSKDRQGRFVSPKRLEYNVGSMENFIADAAAAGVVVDAALLKSQERRASAEMADILSVSPGAILFENTRLFSRQGHATFLETETIAADLCKSVLTEAGIDPSHDLSTRRYSPMGHTADIAIRMRAIEPGEAGHLGLLPHQPGIELHQRVYDASGRVFCFSRQIWRGELAQFSARAIVKERP